MLEKPYFLKEDLEQDEKFKSLDSKDQHALLSLRKDGFCMIDIQIQNSLLDEIVSDCGDAFEKAKNEGLDRARVEGAHLFSDGAKRIALNTHILDLLRTAFGREPIPMGTLNFDRGTEQATHSDTIHFNTYPYGFMCGVWVALEDIDEKNGPLHYYPGSHNLPFFGLDQFSMHGSSNPPSYECYPEYEKSLQQLIESLGLKKESVTMAKGDCLIWAANLLHGGDPILDKSRTRYSQVTHYFFEDCFYYTPLLSSPFTKEFNIRRPMNIITGEPISESDQEKFASNAGVDIRELKGIDKKTNSKEKKSFFKKVFG